LGKLPAQKWSERFDVLKLFADCINQNLEVGLMQAWDVSAFAELSGHNKTGPIGSPTDPFLELLDYIRHDDRLNIVCDDDPETALVCYEHYRAIRAAYKKAKKKAISISFADDFYFPALQAADMVAMLARNEARRIFFGEDYESRDLLDYLITERTRPTMTWKKMFADKATAQRLAKSLQEENEKRSTGSQV
jgi:hypothetical protein